MPVIRRDPSAPRAVRHHARSVGRTEDVYPKAETFDPKRFIDGIKETPLMSARMGARSVARYNREVSRLERGTTGPGEVGSLAGDG